MEMNSNDKSRRFFLPLSGACFENPEFDDVVDTLDILMDHEPSPALQR